MMEFTRNALLIVALLTLAPAAQVYAWEVEYDASAGLLPTAASPAWQVFLRNDPTPTVSDGALRIQHVSPQGEVEYSREGWKIDKGVPVTAEASVRIASAYVVAPCLSIQTKGALLYIAVYTDHMEASPGVCGSWSFSGDFTSFRKLRIAYDGGSRAYAWVDQQLAFSWLLSGSAGQNGVSFGAHWGAGTSDSYWQSVGYSKAYLPLPEPSALLALLTGLGGLGGMIWRRRR